LGLESQVRAGGLEGLKRVDSPLDAVKVSDIVYTLIVEVLLEKWVYSMSSRVSWLFSVQVSALVFR